MARFIARSQFVCQNNSADVCPENIRAPTESANRIGCGVGSRPAGSSARDPESVLLHSVRTTRSVAGHRSDPIRNVAHFGFVADLFSAVEERRIVVSEGSVDVNGTAVCRGKKRNAFAEGKKPKNVLISSLGPFSLKSLSISDR